MVGPVGKDVFPLALLEHLPLDRVVLGGQEARDEVARSLLVSADRVDVDQSTRDLYDLVHDRLGRL